MSSAGFAYRPARFRYVRHYRGGRWDHGSLSSVADLVLNESACVFQYGQACFEGLKAYRTKDGKIISFRPDLNGERMKQSCERMVMPFIPVAEFVQAVDRVVLANEENVPDYGDSSILYIRPFMVGTTPTLGVSPASEFEFRIFVSQVGSYFSDQFRSLSLKVSDYDRAAPRGTGGIKSGINYGMSLYPQRLAHEQGFDDCLYLDPQSHTFVEETGGANILFVDEEQRIIVPKSTSILPSITRRSLITIAQDILQIPVIEKKVPILEISHYKECALCGTATVVAPVATISNGIRTFEYDTSCDGFGPISRQLRDTLTGIQNGELPAPEGWIHVIKGEL